MPLIGFSKLKNKLLDGTKTQTIRLPRKYPFKVGDKLYIYWHLRQKDCEKLGEGIIRSIVRKRADDMTDTDAKKDGFDGYWQGMHCFIDAKYELLETLLALHRGMDGDTQFDIITWEWTTKTFER